MPAGRDPATRAESIAATIRAHGRVRLAYANRNETKHLPYGEGRRAEPLRQALGRFGRPATVILEAPDQQSHQAIRAVLLDAAS